MSQYLHISKQNSQYPDQFCPKTDQSPSTLVDHVSSIKQ